MSVLLLRSGVLEASGCINNSCDLYNIRHTITLHVAKITCIPLAQLVHIKQPFHRQNLIKIYFVLATSMCRYTPENDPCGAHDLDDSVLTAPPSS